MWTVYNLSHVVRRVNKNIKQNLKGVIIYDNYEIQKTFPSKGTES